MLSHLAVRLRDIHAAGYAHRGVKPAHILHHREHNRWSLIDFDRVAVLGSAPPLAFDLAYAAPEVVAADAAAAAADAAAAPLVVTAAADCWSLGVVAFELLTGKPLLGLGDAGKAKVRILGISTCVAVAGVSAGAQGRHACTD